MVEAGIIRIIDVVMKTNIKDADLEEDITFVQQPIIRGQ